MTNSNSKVYGVTISEPETNANIEQFKKSKGIEGDAKAVAEIVKRYFLLSYKQRDALERKVTWKQHRNKGFRTLPSVDPSLPKTKPKKTHPVTSQPLPEQKQAVQELL